ncbi:MAG TPA: alpha-isopropylmalate synthase regulatory domain-containing protein, partial [Candidatus Acidoferrales bacterium]|nr:alpha-isopropylmalate synthase regulatory domain-containing protein [Candidatus Acidoferrales bacterium]
ARSGRSALLHHLERLGYKPEQKDMDAIYEKFLTLADKKKDINDDDLRYVMGDKSNGAKIKLQLLEVFCGTPLKPMATVKLAVNGKEEIATSGGNGPVDAALSAINHIIKKKIGLEEYLVQAITGGTDDLGKVHIQISYKGTSYYGFAADTDIVAASVKAYIDGVNKII